MTRPESEIANNSVKADALRRPLAALAAGPVAAYFRRCAARH